MTTFTMSDIKKIMKTFNSQLEPEEFAKSKGWTIVKEISINHKTPATNYGTASCVVLYSINSRACIFSTAKAFVGQTAQWIIDNWQKGVTNSTLRIELAPVVFADDLAVYITPPQPATTGAEKDALEDVVATTLAYFSARDFIILTNKSPTLREKLKVATNIELQNNLEELEASGIKSRIDVMLQGYSISNLLHTAFKPQRLYTGGDITPLGSRNH